MKIADCRLLIQVGQRVYTNGDCPDVADEFFVGTVTAIEYDCYGLMGFCVRRDDEYSGGGIDNSWMIYYDSPGEIQILEPEVPEAWNPPCQYFDATESPELWEKVIPFPEGDLPPMIWRVVGFEVSGPAEPDVRCAIKCTISLPTEHGRLHSELQFGSRLEFYGQSLLAYWGTANALPTSHRDRTARSSGPSWQAAYAGACQYRNEQVANLLQIMQDRAQQILGLGTMTPAGKVSHDRRIIVK